MLICLWNMTLLLALYCYPNDLIAGTVLLPTQTIIVLICIRYIDQPIAPIRLLSPPDACTVLLPESDNCRACTPATHRPNDRACTPAIYRPNDRACTPTINRPTDRQALCLTTITTAAGTVLPPLVLYYHLNKLLLLPPAAKPTPVPPSLQLIHRRRNA